MDNLSALEVFVRVVQAGSFSAAARALDLTPSAVSKQIGRLEDRLDARLFNRTTRQLNLTEEGAAFFERASRILVDLEEAEQAVSHLRAAPRGTLRLEAPSVFGQLHVAPLLPEYLERYPEVRIELTMSDRFVDLVEEGKDLAIRVGELQDSSLIVRKLASNRRVLCGAPAYFARHSVPRTPAELAQHNCVVYTYRSARNEWRLRDADGEIHTVHVRGNLEADNAEALRQVLLNGLGIGLLPLWLVGHDLCCGRLVEVLTDYEMPDSAVHAIYPPGRHLSPKVRSFVDFLVERFKDGLPGGPAFPRARPALPDGEAAPPPPAAEPQPASAGSAACP